MDKKIGAVLEILTDIAIAAGIVLAFCVPWLVQSFVPEYNDYATYIFAYSIAALALWFLFELRTTTVSVRRGNPFTSKTAGNLLRMGITCSSISFILLLAAIFEPDYIIALLSGCLCLMTLLASLSAFVCSFLFKRAIEYREDNELTI